MPKHDDNTDDELNELGFQFAQAASEMDDEDSDKAFAVALAMLIQEFVSVRSRVAVLEGGAAK